MSRKRKVAKNLAVIAILASILLIWFSSYLNPSLSSLYRLTEADFHYGPSEIIHITDFEGERYILGRYDRWISCYTFEKKFLVLWQLTSPSHGLENQQERAVNYQMGKNCLYGIINDERIKRIEATLNNGKALSQDQFYEGIFLITMPAAAFVPDTEPGSDSYERGYVYLTEVRGYDEHDQVIFYEKDRQSTNGE